MKKKKNERGDIIKRGLSDNAVYKARNDSRNIKVSGRRGGAGERIKGSCILVIGLAIVVIYAGKGN